MKLIKIEDMPLITVELTLAEVETLRRGLGFAINAMQMDGRNADLAAEFSPLREELGNIMGEFDR